MEKLLKRNKISALSILYKLKNVSSCCVENRDQLIEITKEINKKFKTPIIIKNKHFIKFYNFNI